MIYRCGIIGLGRIGCGFHDDFTKNEINTHAGAYLSNKKTELVALCDIDKRKLSKYGKKYRIKKLYSNYIDMLKNEKLDCVSICTLSDSHHEIVKAAAKNVKGIFLEKPISDSLNNALKILKISQQKKVKIQIDHQRRFSTFYQKIRDIIKSKKLGKIQHVNIYYGAGILNTGTHVFDLVNFFFGKVNQVEGWRSKHDIKNTMDPNINGIIICKNNIECNLISLDVTNYRTFEFDIIGTEGRLKINLGDNKADLYKIDKIRKGPVFKELILKEFSNKDDIPHIVRGLNNLLLSMENNSKPLCDAFDGYSSLEISLALIESAKKNKIITLPIKPNIFKT